MGEKIDLTGIKVTANYVKEQKEVSGYKISGFETTTPGEHIATVTYEGISNTFSYTVVENIKNYKTLTEYLNEAGYKTSDQFVSGFSIGEKISDIKSKLGNNEINIKVNTETISTGTEFSYNGEKYIAIVYGDINGDGKVNIKDWNIMYKYINGTRKFTEQELKCADVNEDGKVNIKDWNRLYKHINGTNPLF